MTSADAKERSQQPLLGRGAGGAPTAGGEGSREVGCGRHNAAPRGMGYAKQLSPPSPRAAARLDTGRVPAPGAIWPR